MENSSTESSNDSSMAGSIGASIDKLASRLIDALPRELGNLKSDAEANLKAALAGGLRRMDLVTREEFELQRAVLERTRQKLDALEARLKELDAAS